MNAWRSKNPNANGKYPLRFQYDRFCGEHIQIPCGQCALCRLERSRQWATRIMHESQLHENNCFLTLTFDEDNLPEDMSIRKRDMQLFLKKLRKKNPHLQIKYYLCGEYGEKNLRPHYHLCLFNYDPLDKVWTDTTKLGHRLYQSEEIADLWKKGLHWIGELTFESAAYVARYVMKKQNGKKAKKDKTYQRVCSTTGEIFQVEPEFALMSLKSAIGKDWFELYKDDAYPSDYITVNGKKVRPPKYYDTQFEKINPEQLEEIKTRRAEKAKKHFGKDNKARLNTKEKILKLRLERLQRNKVG
jgi:hypothetical protein